MIKALPYTRVLTINKASADRAMVVVASNGPLLSSGRPMAAALAGGISPSYKLMFDDIEGIARMERHHSGASHGPQGISDFIYLIPPPPSPL